NNNLTDLSGLSNLKTVGNNFWVADNTALTTINGLNALQTTGQFYIGNNAALTTINFSNTLTGLTSFTIVNNPLLQSINGFNNITSISGSLNINNNTVLQNFNAFSKLSSVGNLLQFSDNTQLQNIDSLHKLTTVGGAFNIAKNGALTHLNGFRKLTSVGGFFQLWDNDNLVNIDSLYKLTNVGAELIVEENPQLTNISALAGVNPNTIGGTYGLYIVNNTSLSVCNLPNFCTYLANPSNTHPRTISGNLTNCLNEAAVVAACTAPTNEYVNFLGTMFVKKGASGTGSSWSNAIGELADALVLAKSINDTSAGKVKEIWVTSGTYKPMYSPEDGANFGTNQGRNNAFSLLNNVKLYGGFAGSESSFSQRILDTANPTILSGDIDNNNLLDNGNTYHVLVAAGVSSSTVLDGFTIKMGYASSTGSLVVNGNSVERRVGGGIINYSSSPIIRNCIITQNRTDYDGGGMANYFSSNPTITQCFFTGNTASYGGAIENYNNSNPIINNSLFAGNNANYGSGIESYQNSISVITNCTFSGNSASNAGVIYSYGTSTEPIITNTIIYGNNFGLNYLPTNIISNSLIQGLAGGSNGNLNGNSDPLFVNAPSYILAPFTNGDYRLQIGSPAINTGTSDTTGFNIGNRDVVGIARIVGGTIDMGAYESYKKFYYTTGSNEGYVLSNWKSNIDGTGSSPSAFKEAADFTIQSGHTITLNNGMDLDVGNNDVIVQPNAVINGNMPLITGGTLTNNGTISTLAILFGNLHQTIKGNGTITNLGLNNSAGATIETNSTVNITGTYTPVLGTLTTNNGLILLSNENGTARIAQGTDNYINGNVTIERYIPAKAARKWSFITSPVSGTIHNTWQQQIHITGAGTGGTVCPTFTPHINGFDATVSSAPNIYTYDALQISGNRWKVPSSTLSDIIDAGKAFRVNIRGDRSLGCSLLDGSPSGLVPSAVTLRATGALSNAAKNMGSFSVIYPNNGVNNYVFVGNPYPSAISFSALLTTNNSSINNTYALYVPSSPSGVYSYWDGSTFTGGTGYDNTKGNIIASGQAFFVQSKVAGNLTMFFEESHKTDGANTGYFRTNNYNEKIRVHYLQNDNSQMDEIVIRYANDATINNVEESSLDIASINSGSNYLTSLKGNKGMAVQTRDLQTHTTDTVWLNVVSTQSGAYKLNFSEFENFATADIYLIDHYTKTTQNVKQNTVYEFSVDKDNAATKGTQRFSVVFNKKQSPELTLNKNIKLYPNPANKQVYVQLPQSAEINYNIKVTNMVGKIVLQQKATNSTEQLNISKLSKGTYIVEIIDSKGNRTTEKLVKN
ncbi:MAG: T9SS type A sorting domain-containing protein, partial [Chitinophagaceae bacterium]|nr:T9SS type A sorting domain-containing protein [Chitinophagaceae bacterium]